MITIYSQQTSPRLEYTIKYIFNHFFNTEYLLTTNENQFENAKGVKINYSPKVYDNVINIYSDKLLFQTGTNEIKPKYFSNNGKHYLFLSPNQNYSLPYDIFSAVFYMISRYEEYGKGFDFRYIHSIAYKHNFLRQPVVNIWLDELHILINKMFPQEQNIKMPKYQYISTIDIDNAYAYKYKGIIRYALSTTRSIILNDMEDIKTRLATTTNKRKDPYDTYDYIKQIHKQVNITPKIFILLSNYGKLDKNLHYKNKKYRKLIKELDQFAEVGIHPGYASNFNKNKLKEEIKRLEDILNRKITISRQHFLVLSFPYTYQTLLENGIQEDYSMGYSRSLGFRAGTTVPFFFYDLEKEKETTLKIYPFAVMDITLNKYMGHTPCTAIEETSKFIKYAKKYGGYFISAWHNESLSEYKHWNQWKKVFEYILKYGSK